VTSSSAKNLYEHLDKAALLALVMERDATIEAQHQELVNAMEQIKKINRLLNLRNKKIFGSASEKHNRINVVEDLDFEELEDQRAGVGKGAQPIDAGDAAPEGQPDQESIAIGNKGKKRSYPKGHPGRNPLPAHLRREVEHFYPEGYDSTWNREMPAEITERLTLNIDFYVKVDVRHKFARGSGIVIAPWRLEDPFYKYKATTELVCHMMRLRFGLHVPYYRFCAIATGV